MNPYTQNLNRIEFMMTLACTGKCKHCSEGTHDAGGTFIDCDAAVDVVSKVAEQYKIASLMTFGGEPLLQWKRYAIFMQRREKQKFPKDN